MAFPSKIDFESLRLLLFNVFEIVMMVLAMAAVILAAWNRIRPTRGSPDDIAKKKGT